jgi:signal transduction histidine kinase/ligand-binding sensor domain-containing protein
LCGFNNCAAVTVIFDTSTPLVFRRLLHIIPFLICLAAGAQRKQYVFTRISTKDGLAANHVYSIVQDRKGFMWFASVNGLHRYDGRKVISFRPGPGDTAFLPSEPVSQIHLDKKNRFWVRIKQDIGLFSPATFEYKPVPMQVAPGILEQSDVRLWEDNEGNIFSALSKNGILVYNEQKGAFVCDTSLINLPPNVGFSCLQQDPISGNYWLGTTNGLVLFDRKSGRFYTPDNNPFSNPVLQQEFARKDVKALFFDSRRRLWIVNWALPEDAEVLSCYDPRSGSITSDIKISIPGHIYREVHNFREQRNGTLWLYGLSVLAEFGRATGRFEYMYNREPYDFGISYGVVYDFYEDKEQNIWLGTDKGVYVFNPGAQRFNSISLSEAVTDGKADRSLTSFLELRNGDIWAGSWGKGIFVYDRSLGAKPHDVYNNAPADDNYLLVWSLLEQAGTRKIWIGCQMGRLMIYDPATRKTLFIKHPVFGGRTIRQVAQDIFGNIWFGTQRGGIIKWSPSKGKANVMEGFERVLQLNSNILSIKCDDQGRTWVGAERDGIKVLDSAGNIVETYDNKQGPGKSLSELRVTDILFFDDTTVVICARALNILNSKTGNIQIVNAAGGLPSNTVNTAQRDRDGNLWLALINGLCRYNIRRNVFTLFSQRDGIVDHDFEYGSSMMLRDGRLLFNNQRDLTYFDPEQIVPSSSPPDVSITDFKLFNMYLPPDSILQLDRVTLNHNQNSITIEFAALSFLQRNKMIYYYKLEGIEEGWTRTDLFPIANFALLPPGDYTFKVRCENSDGVPSQNITSLRIHIRPPFWRQEWFIVFCIFAVAGLIYLAHRMRLRQLMEMEKVRGRIARDLHDDMGSTLSTINILSEMAKMKVNKDTQKTSEYISKISDNSNRMMEAMDDIVWSINPMNDSMQRISARMREFATSVLEAKEIEVAFRVDEKVKDLRLDMESRRDFFLLFKEAVNNIAKYSRARNAEIDITVHAHRLVMQVKDNGIGFNVQEADSGNGLTNMRKRAESLRGHLTIDSVAGVGTKVRLEAPLT